MTKAKEPSLNLEVSIDEEEISALAISEMVDVIAKYSTTLSPFEMIGILDVLKSNLIADIES